MAGCGLKPLKPNEELCMLSRLLTITAFLIVSIPSWTQEIPYTVRFVSEWSIPPAQRTAYLTYLDENVKPVFEKLSADGTVLNWGIYTTAVYDENSFSNGCWFEAATMAGIDRVLAQLGRLKQSQLITADVKHRDMLLRTTLRRSKEGSGKDGYYYFNSTLLQPTKRDQWRQWWDKYQKPMYEQFLAEGLVSMYEIEAGEIHTMDPSWVYLAYVAPSAEALDKINAAFQARGNKRNAEESRAISDEYDAVIVAGSHRDYLAHANSYAQK